MATAFSPIGSPPPAMQFFRSYNYIFENPNGWINLLLCGLCLLSTAFVPVVGQLVVLGYTIEILQSLMATSGQRYPDFDFNRFSDYLNKSIWPFLVQLVASLLLVPIAFLIFPLVVFVPLSIATAAGEDAGPIILIIMIPLIMILSIAIGVTIFMFLTPLILRAMLAQDFKAAWDLGWIKSFIRLMYREMILTGLFLSLSSIALGLLGIATCGIGLLFAQAMIFLASTHLNYQQYMIFLARGGAPVPPKQVAEPIVPAAGPKMPPPSGGNPFR